MTLKELGTLWGNPIIKLQEYAKKYRIGSIFLYTLDIGIMAGLSIIMYKQRSSFNTYMFVMVIFVIIFSLIFNMYLNSDKWAAFKFYRRHKNAPVEIKKYRVSAQNMYSVIYCMNYKRLKPDKDLKDYLEMVLNACNEDWTFSKSFMKYIAKYEDAETGNIEVYVIHKKKKDYFVDYKTDITKLVEPKEDSEEKSADTEVEDVKTEETVVDTESQNFESEQVQSEIKEEVSDKDTDTEEEKSEASDDE